MSSIETVVIATRNRGKLREFQTLLQPSVLKILGLADISLDSDCEETGKTFAQNARVKALAYSMQTSLPVLADDSGLEVSALGGRPGIFSARYAGPEATDEDKIEKLLKEVRAARAKRDARFVCALALAREGVVLLEAEGECRGVIAESPRGNNGFGYDPIFFLPELGRTYAELSDEEKNQRSHRARAVRNLLAGLTRI